MLEEVAEAIEGIGNVNLEKSLMDVATAIKGIKSVQRDQDLPDFCKKEQKKFPSLKVMKKNKAAVGCSPKSPAHSTDSEEATRKNFNLFI